MVSLIAAMAAVAVLATLVFVGAGRLSEARAETAVAQEEVAAQDQEIAELSDDVVTAQDATEQAQQEATDARGEAGAAQGTIAALAQCAVGMMGAVNAVDGTFGTENWGRFYTQANQALPHCTQAADRWIQSRRWGWPEKYEAVRHS